MKPSDITNAIAAGNHDLDSIAAALDVNHTNGTLRTYLKMLCSTGAVTRSYSGVRDPDRGPVYRFDLNTSVSDEMCGCHLPPRPMGNHSLDEPTP